MNEVMNPTEVGTRGPVQISKTELTRLRNDENYTIPQLAERFNVSNETIKRAMQSCGLSTSLNGRKRNTYTLVD